MVFSSYNQIQFDCPNDETGVSQYVDLEGYSDQKVPQNLTILRYFSVKKGAHKGDKLKVHFLVVLALKSALFDQKC